MLARTTVAPQAPSAKPKGSARGQLVHISSPSEQRPGNLVMWYLGLIPHWTHAGPRLRTRLLLRTHQWIVERIVAPGASLSAAAADLHPDGELTRILTDLVPAAEDSDDRRQFIRALVANLRHALLRPVTRRNEAWVRWLFLIPYSVKGWDGAGGGASANGMALATSAAASL